METPTPPQPVPGPNVPPTAARVSRRALLRAGAGASPVLLTLAASPVSAATQCTVASSFISVATFKSRNPNVATIQCSTQNADYWREQAAVRPVPDALKVRVRDLLGTTSSSYNNERLADVMAAGTGATVQTSGELGVLQHLVALALNLNAGFIAAAGAFNLSYIQGIWSNYKTNGNRYVLPASAINWGDAEIIAWLRYLMYPAALP